MAETTSVDVPADFVRYSHPILRVLNIQKSISEVWSMLSNEERRMYNTLSVNVHPLLKIKPVQPMTPYGIFVTIEREKLLKDYPKSTPYDISIVLRERYNSISTIEMEKYISLARNAIEVYRIAHKEWMAIVHNVLREYYLESGLSIPDSDWKNIPMEFAMKLLDDTQ